MAVLLLTYCLVLCGLVSTQDARLPPSVIHQGTECMGSPLSDDDVCLYRDDGRVRLVCIATGCPAPQYKWYKDGSEITNFPPNIYQQEEGTILLEPATTLDEGYYQCRADNVHGTALGNTYQLRPAVLGRYPRNSPTQEYTASPGDPLQLDYSPLKSIPVSDKRWLIAVDRLGQNPEVVELNPRINIDEQGNLHFAYVRGSDAVAGKLYKTYTYNSYLDMTVGGSYSRIIIRNPGPAPDSAPIGQYQNPAPQETYIALVGSDLTLRCLFSGKPVPYVTWNRTEDVLPAGRHQYESFETMLVIHNVNESDAGQYRCVGTNSYGQAELTFSVKVEAAPVFRNAVDTQKPINTNATEGENVTFNCRTFALPTASVMWLVNGVPVNDGDLPERMSISNDGQSLTISKVCKDCQGERATDLMVVQCNASNAHGYALGDGYLNVLLRTVIDAPPPLEATLRTNVTLELPCHAIADNSTHVTYQWYVQGRQAVINHPVTWISPDNDFIIDPAGLAIDEYRNYTGVYTCEATNGYSTASEDCLVKSQPVFRNSTETETARPVKTNATEGEDEDVTLTCRPHDLPAACVQWFKNGGRVDENNDTLTGELMKIKRKNLVLKEREVLALERIANQLERMNTSP